MKGAFLFQTIAYNFVFPCHFLSGLVAYSRVFWRVCGQTQRWWWLRHGWGHPLFLHRWSLCCYLKSIFRDLDMKYSCVSQMGALLRYCAGLSSILVQVMKFFQCLHPLRTRCSVPSFKQLVFSHHTCTISRETSKNK